MISEMPIDRILSEALETPTGLRSAFLDRVCGSDAALRAKVHGLIAVLERNPNFLASPTADVQPPENSDGSSLTRPANASSAVSAMPAGSCIGPYRLLERLGEG